MLKLKKGMKNIKYIIEKSCLKILSNIDADIYIADDINIDVICYVEDLVIEQIFDECFLPIRLNLN